MERAGAAATVDGDVSVTQEDRIERLEEALRRIVEWSEAYPFVVFPKPDRDHYARVHEVLTANGMTLDRISADIMRHVTEGMGKIARDGLATAK
jgi:hypothetical protein